MELVKRVCDLKDVEPEGSNNVRAYYPIRGKHVRQKSDLFDYGLVAGNVLSCLLGKKLTPGYDFCRFRDDCREEMLSRVTSQELVEHLDQMYFTSDVLRTVSPEFVLLSPTQKITPATKNLSKLFETFFISESNEKSIDCKVTFVEKIFLDIVKSRFSRPRQDLTEELYIPFISQYFIEDLNFLKMHTEYMLSQLENFLEFYNFLYCSQLALNIRIFIDGEPKSKPLYFILDTEKASQERGQVARFGYKHLYDASGYIFPVLALLEHFNFSNDSAKTKYPLWQFANAIRLTEEAKREGAREALFTFGKKFVRDKFKDQYHKPMLEPLSKPDAISVMQGLVQSSIRQFEPGKNKKSEAPTVFKGYKNAFVRHTARHFVEPRGRTGNALVINQDYLMLLTNLAIRDHRQLRFQELLTQFERRGQYHSAQTLPSIYQ